MTLGILVQQYSYSHHSAVSFDREKTVTVSGKITRSVWRNPHMAINIDVINDSGEATLWKIEGPGTTILAGRGLNNQMYYKAD